LIVITYEAVDTIKTAVQTEPLHYQPCLHAHSMHIAWYVIMLHGSGERKNLKAEVKWQDFGRTQQL
jgi:hypothetical protein